MLAEQRSVAAIFAHPDDEVLGAGAALAGHARQGDNVNILLLSRGLAAREVPDKRMLDAHLASARKAAETLGAVGVTFEDFPDNQMDSVPLLDIVRCVEVFLEKVNPTRIYTHHIGDLNVDHRLAYQAVMTACRPLPGAKNVEILAAEVNSSTEWSSLAGPAFQPTVFIDARETLAVKQAALECYAGELRPWPHPRSLEGVRTLAAYRGMQSGLELAEAFVLCRRLETYG